MGRALNNAAIMKALDSAAHKTVGFTDSNFENEKIN
jgi:hypothetical protein